MVRFVITPILLVLVILASAGVVYWYTTSGKESQRMERVKPQTSSAKPSVEEAEAADVNSAVPVGMGLGQPMVQPTSRASSPPATSPAQRAAVQGTEAEGSESAQRAASRDGEEERVYLSIFADRVALYRSLPGYSETEGLHPFRKFDIPIDELQEDQVARLRIGIDVENEAAALSILEGWRGMMD